MRKIIVYILLIASIVPASWYLFGHGYFIMHDDLQVMRVFQMGKCFLDGQIPCRWSPDMAYGYGQAMFNFYSALPYYLGQLLRMILPLSILGTVKTLFFISIVGAAVGMYLLAKEFWGRLGGLLASVLYTYAPYHALDIFVRGALAESFALALLPFLFLYLYRLVMKPNFKNIALVAIFLSFLLTTHNISSLIYAPFTILWVLFWILYQRKWSSIKHVGLAGLLGLGISAFFVLPAVFEQSIVQLEHLTSEYSDYHAHFVVLRQLFIDRSWGFGPSIFGPYDDISFQIGWPHWWLAIPVSFLGLRWFLKKKIEGLIVLGFLGLFLLTSFLTHPRSLFIWERVPLISFVQFPWRFLGLTAFFLSFVGAALARPKFIFRKVVLIAVILITILLNLRYFEPGYFSREITDSDKLTGVGYELQEKAAILDYLPKTAEIAPPGPASAAPKLISGEGVTENFTKQSNRFSFDADIYKEAEIVLPVMYFPDWILVVDNTKVESGIHGAHGVISVKLPKGRHIVRGRFVNTPIRSVGNFVTALSLIILFSGAVLSEKTRKKK